MVGTVFRIPKGSNLDQSIGVLVLYKHTRSSTLWRNSWVTMGNKITNMCVPPFSNDWSICMLKTFILDALRSDIHISYNWTSHCYSISDTWLCCQNPVSETLLFYSEPLLPVWSTATNPVSAMAPAQAPGRHLPARGWIRNAAVMTWRQEARFYQGWFQGHFPQQTGQRNRFDHQ